MTRSAEFFEEWQPRQAVVEGLGSDVVARDGSLGGLDDHDVRCSMEWAEGSHQT